jgi:VanZ family protein
MLLWLLRTIAWSVLLAIVVLSVVPGDLRPHVLSDKHFEHLDAYVVSGVLFALGYRQLRFAILFGMLLTICAAALELVQLGIIGRTSSLSDFLASSAGAWIGLAAGNLLTRLHRLLQYAQPPRENAAD